MLFVHVVTPSFRETPHRETEREFIIQGIADVVRFIHIIGYMVAISFYHTLPHLTPGGRS